MRRPEIYHNKGVTLTFDGGVGFVLEDAQNPLNATIHAGGLRYHGMAPLVSLLLHMGAFEASSVHQLEAFQAGVQFARAEGIVPAPEANHAVAGAMREAIRCREEGVSRAVLFNLCGHGHFDMQAYMDYAAGKLHDYEYPEEEIAMALAGLPVIGSDGA